MEYGLPLHFWVSARKKNPNAESGEYKATDSSMRVGTLHSRRVLLANLRQPSSPAPFTFMEKGENTRIGRSDEFVNSIKEVARRDRLFSTGV
jgi:hypothetical protein